MPAPLPTIQEIMARMPEDQRYFFSQSTMIFFNQKLTDFQIERCADGRVYIWAPSYSTVTGELLGITQRFIDMKTGEFTHY
jgi:hypothetical protein